MPGTSPPDDFQTQPPPQVGSIWWYRDTSACGVVTRSNDRSVHVRILNLPGCRRRIAVESFYAEWHRTPRLAAHWYNRGSLWRKIDRGNGGGPVRVVGERFELDGINDGGYTAFRGNRPSTFRGGLGAISSFELASNHVRVWERAWPDQPVPHPESQYVQDQESVPPPRPRRTKKAKASKKAKPVKKAAKKKTKGPTVFDRIAGEDII